MVQSPDGTQEGPIETCRPSRIALGKISVRRGACRYTGVAGERGCWGRVRGTLVYSNVEYHRAGNFPSEILYSCQQHRQLNDRQEQSHRCEKCQLLFREESCYNEVVCRACYDRVNLQNPDNWIRLSTKHIQDVSFSDILTKSLQLEDKKSLPSSLKKTATIEFDLDIAYAIEQADLEPDDDIPLYTFWEGNRARVDEFLGDVRERLQSAKQTLATRALFVRASASKTAIYADRSAIAVEEEDETSLLLMTTALGQWWSVLFPFLATFVLVLLALHVYSDLSVIFNDDPIPEYAVQDLYTPMLWIELLQLIAILSVIILPPMITYLFWREHFQRVLRGMAMITMGLALAVTPLFVFLSLQVYVPFDWVTINLVALNFGVCGAYAFWCPSPRCVIKFFQIMMATVTAWECILLLG
eukprot:96152_1